MTQMEETQSGLGAPSAGFPLSGLPTRITWLFGLGAILVVLVVA